MCEILWPWLQTHEYVAVWLEGIDLVLILGLDWKERQERRREQEIQHKETLEQSEIARAQADATRKSADAATEAALAAKRSAEIAASLHRPFVGLSKAHLQSGWGKRTWEIAFTLRNYGTLPALDVGATIEVIIENASRANMREPKSFEVFPSAESAIVFKFDMGEPDRPSVHDETKKLRIAVRISYRAEDGRHFEYLAEVYHLQGQFPMAKSETRALSIS
jgi:multidrug efflux pump subunit AcrA (membrane-fusion protein)